MTREELKRHCQKQIENCEMWARIRGEEPHETVYEEHKLILELLEQEPVIDKLRTEIEQTSETIDGFLMHDGTKRTVLQIIDKYKAETEQTDGND